MTTTTPSQGILSDDKREAREELIGLLTQAYWMEIETVMSYIANSINPDGVRAHVIKGVIEAETGAIEHYNRIIEFCEEHDPVTQDMVIDILRDEEGHRRMFEGFLREYQAEGLA